MKALLLAASVLALAAPAAGAAPARTAAPAPASAKARVATKAPVHPRSVLPFIADDWTRAVALAKQRRVPLFIEAWAPW